MSSYPEPTGSRPIAIHGNPLCYRLSLPLLMICFGCFLAPAEEEPVPPPIYRPRQIRYETKDIEWGYIEEGKKLTAYFEPAGRESLYFHYNTGYIRRLNIPDDLRVEAGQILAELYAEVDETDIAIQRLRLRRAAAFAELQRGRHAAPREIEQARLSMRQEELRLQELTLQRERSLLRAPFDGELLIDGEILLGTPILDNRPLMYIVRPDSFELIYDGFHIRDLKVGMIAEATIEGEIYDAELIQMRSVSRRRGYSSRQQAVFRLYSYEDEGERPDYAPLYIKIQGVEDAMLVPTEALTGSMMNSHYLRVINENGLMVEREIKIGIRNNDLTEVKSGLQESDRIVLEVIEE